MIEALEKSIVKLARKRISRKIFKEFDGQVRYGPFKGLKLSSDTNTSQGTLGAKALGMYERGLVERIAELGPFDDMANFGAADGYMSLGFILAGVAKRSICFEMTEQGRASVRVNAEANGLSAAVEVCGKADETTANKLKELNFNLQNGLVICDIEGAEFNLFDAAFFEGLKGSVIVIELHDQLMPEGKALRDAMIAQIPDGLSHEVFVDRALDWNGIPELDKLTDYERALVCIDGRKILGEWLIVHKA